MDRLEDLGSASQTGTPLATRSQDRSQRASSRDPQTRRVAAGAEHVPAPHRVLALLLLGWSNKLIARELALSVETVKQIRHVC